MAAKWLEVLKVVGPASLLFIPGVGPVLAPIVIGAIETAEKIPGATGPEKKARAIELVKAGAAATNAVQGKVEVDPEQAAAAADNAIDAVVAATNAVQKKAA